MAGARAARIAANWESNRRLVVIRVDRSSHICRQRGEITPPDFSCPSSILPVAQKHQLGSLRGQSLQIIDLRKASRAKARGIISGRGRGRIRKTKPVALPSCSRRNDARSRDNTGIDSGRNSAQGPMPAAFADHGRETFGKHRLGLRFAAGSSGMLIPYESESTIASEQKHPARCPGQVLSTRKWL